MSPLGEVPLCAGVSRAGGSELYPRRWGGADDRGGESIKVARKEIVTSEGIREEPRETEGEREIESKCEGG